MGLPLGLRIPASEQEVLGVDLCWMLDGRAIEASIGRQDIAIGPEEGFAV